MCMFYVRIMKYIKLENTVPLRTVTYSECDGFNGKKILITYRKYISNKRAAINLNISERIWTKSYLRFESTHHRF